MVTLNNPKVSQALKRAVKLAGPKGMVSKNTVKAAGYGTAGFYSFRVVNSGVDRALEALTDRSPGIPDIVLRILAGIGDLAAIRFFGNMLQGSIGMPGAQAFTLGGMLGILQGLIVGPLVSRNMPEGKMKDLLSAPGDWGGDLDTNPKQPLAGAGSAYPEEFNSLDQPYYEGLNGEGDQSEYANVQLGAEDEEVFIYNG